MEGEYIIHYRCGCSSLMEQPELIIAYNPDCKIHLKLVQKENGMTFNEYSIKAHSTAIYPDNQDYPVLGLCGETGEVAEKIKKLIRGDYTNKGTKFKKDLMKELGDVLWYWNEVCLLFGLQPEKVASLNLLKLQKRKEEGKLQGSGDNR